MKVVQELEKQGMQWCYNVVDNQIGFSLFLIKHNTVAHDVDNEDIRGKEHKEAFSTGNLT